MIEWLFLAIFGGILLGYGGHDIIRKTICRFIRELYWFYHYKILKEPEPDFQEMMAKIIPSTFAALIGMKLGQDIAKEYEESVIKSKLKDKGEK